MAERDFALYIHIPFCISKCSYCDFFSVTDCGDEKLEMYIDSLCKEIDFRLHEAGSANRNGGDEVLIKSVYIGGGTPSLLKERHFNKIFDAIRNNSSGLILAEDCEITVELNPDDVSGELLGTLWKMGVNRISVGIQSMTDQVLKKVRRRAGRKENIEALETIKKEWKGIFSLDLISALPLESMESFEKGLREVMDYKPHHISLYSLTIEEETPLGKELSGGELDYDFDFADKMWLLGRDILEKSGYGQYEVSNFALRGYECRHNLYYWNHKSYIGCGSGGTGSLYKADGTGFRWTNTEDVETYIQFWGKTGGKLTEKLPQKQPQKHALKLPQTQENVSPADSKFEFFMMGLRKMSGITNLEYQEIFGQPLPESFIALAKEWQKKGLFEITGEKEGSLGRYRMSKEGILFLNKFLIDLSSSDLG